MPVLSPREVAAANAESFRQARAEALAEGRREGDLENRDFVSEEVEYTAPGGVNLRGAEQRSDYYRVWEDAFSDRTTVEDEVIVSGSTVVTESTFTGRHTGVFRIRGLDHIPPTGKDVRVSLLSIQDVKRGRIVSIRWYFDRMEFLEQLGATEYGT
jgi:predicted ester cyclase